MSFLFDEIIFGPVHSRRFGTSLGVNLLPTKHKICSFDCIYCECGWTESNSTFEFPERVLIKEALEIKLYQLKNSGVNLTNITWAGNGEPTLHPDFAGIVDDVIALRDQFFPETTTTVLSNSTTLYRKDVFCALQKVDKNVMKLDAGTDSMYKAINQCNTDRTLEQITEDLCDFKGDLIIQTLFLRGKNNGITIDNTNEYEVAEWLKKVQLINPKSVMLYPIDRATPAFELEKIGTVELRKIADQVEKLGIKTEIYE